VFNQKPGDGTFWPPAEVVQGRSPGADDEGGWNLTSDLLEGHGDKTPLPCIYAGYLGRSPEHEETDEDEQPELRLVPKRCLQALRS